MIGSLNVYINQQSSTLALNKNLENCQINNGHPYNNSFDYNPNSQAKILNYTQSSTSSQIKVEAQISQNISSNDKNTKFNSDSIVKSQNNQQPSSKNFQHRKESNQTQSNQTRMQEQPQPSTKMDEQINSTEEMEQQSLTAEQQKSKILKELYYQKRKDLIKWVRVQCKRFKINYQTYANSIHLMDQYYKYTKLDRAAFVKYALCMIIISTKAFETKVLFTGTVAKNNKFDFKQTLQIQQQLIQYFDYRISSYNFVRVVLEYMVRWDNYIQQKQTQTKVFFLKEKYQFYQLYLQMLFICENYLTCKKSLLQRKIKNIFKFVLDKRCKQEVDKIVDRIFLHPYIEKGNQQQYSYQIQGQSSKDEKQFLQKSTNQFNSLIPQIKQRYGQRKNYKSYGQFLSLLF